ncbi:hypothetical protein QF042_004751 [Pedobacter sp. W3I1]|uniref:hypothetical protein n=1 Tax=Pedobacter sp. W3I1 TaxID=3042291 RepID=UPI0027872077|nr:hypothetical protein [Pedobacter sp. W3I1]MDQ0641186.1 hypothetical protein [Pedobacter sp. W3I1]
MKKYIKLIFIPITLLLTNCTSGQNSPADSHPGSGSVKAGRNDKAAEKKDTSKADSTRTSSKKVQ